MDNETITIPRKLAEDILCQMQTSEISPNTLFLLMQIMLNNKRDTPEQIEAELKGDSND